MTEGKYDFNWDEAIIFVFIATFTQTNAGGGTIDVRFRSEAGNQTKILSGNTGADDYTGGETVQVEIRTDSGRILLLRKIDTAVDNENLPFPFIAADAGTLAPSSNDFPMPLEANVILQGLMEMRIFTTTLVQNETLKVTFTYKSRTGNPIGVDTSDSTGTVSTTTTQHTVV